MRGSLDVEAVEFGPVFPGVVVHRTLYAYVTTCFVRLCSSAPLI
jgi:hypothetical protein